MHQRKILLFLTFCFFLLNNNIHAQRVMERLSRGVVAVNEGNGKVYVSWRMLVTDPDDVAFNIYRTTGNMSAVKLNSKPITESTNYVDKVDTTNSNSYIIKTILKGKETEASKAFVIPANAPVRQYLSIPLQTPPGYMPNDASVGDLDGDGDYEIILHQTGRARDNSQAGITDPPIFQAYKMDGTLLWTINLGKNIREGAHYTQFMVYDLDGDGKAEVACKTADGTVDGKGKVIGDAQANYVNPATGRILDGPEFLTIFNGATGAELVTANYIPPRGKVSDWGDNYGNRVDRFLACIAYLDGRRPGLVMCRGYDTRAVLAARNCRSGKLARGGHFDTQ